MRAARRALLSGLATLSLSGAALASPASAQTAALGSSPAGSAASAATQPASGDVTIGPRLERACLRIPNLELRTNNLTTRLDGGTDTRGSLAWLGTKVEAAKAADRDQLATVLENRLTVRTKTREVLDLRKADLAQFRTWCENQGVSL